jgi:hypothetical protein
MIAATSSSASSWLYFTVSTASKLWQSSGRFSGQCEMSPMTSPTNWAPIHEAHSKKCQSISKVSCFDLSIIASTLIAERERTITRQQHAIRELSTPVLQIRDRLLILPIIGVLDFNRAKQLATDLFAAIRACRGKSRLPTTESASPRTIMAKYSRLFPKRIRLRAGPKAASGRGLSVVRAIVEAHRGKIVFLSEEGRGATFDFNLPIEAAR